MKKLSFLVFALSTLCALTALAKPPKAATAPIKESKVDILLRETAEEEAAAKKAEQEARAEEAEVRRVRALLRPKAEPPVRPAVDPNFGDPLAKKGEKPPVPTPPKPVREKFPDDPMMPASTPPPANPPEKRPVEADPGKDTPPPPAAQPEPPKCDLAPLTLPANLMGVITREIVTIKKNEEIIDRHANTSQEYAAKYAEFQACMLKGGSTCRNPGGTPQAPRLLSSYISNLTRADQKENKARFNAAVGEWIICSELRRAYAKKKCEDGDAKHLAILEGTIKAECSLVIPTAR